MSTPIQDLMVKDIVTVTPDLTIEHVRFKMRHERIHALPVVDASGQPIGIVSASDLLDELAHGTPAHQIMTRRLVTIEVDTTAEEAARMMWTQRIHHLLVTDGGRIVGIVSSFDLLKLLADQAPPA